MKLPSHVSESIKRLNPELYKTGDTLGAVVSKKPERNKVQTPKSGRSTDEDRLNKTEKAYLAHLRSRNVDWIGIQNITLKLADDCRLTVDFVYRDLQGQFVFVDVKGFQREDALIKMKVAARLFPFWRFKIVSKEDSGWITRDVKP